eukprot:SAG11_NODE_29361_length_311_cov_1.702830_1_plen_75_part_10
MTAHSAPHCHCCFATRSALALICLLVLGPAPVAASAVADGNAKQCTNAQGLTRPCGPGNDQCNASQPPPLPRYHV